MAKVITTTTFTNSDDRDNVITMHITHGYTLVRTESSDRARVRWSVRSPLDLPRVMQAFDTTPEAPTFGVNWAAARGTQGTVDARVYAALVTIAADVADVFNRIVADNN